MAAPTAPVLGFNGKAYYNTGTYGSPTWSLINNVGDIKVTMDADEGEIPLRSGGGFMMYAAGLIKASWEWTSIWNPADTVLMALMAIFDARTPTEFLFLDQASGTTGSSGMRCCCQIFKFPRQEELSKAMMVDIAVKPTFSANPPARYTAA